MILVAESAEGTKTGGQTLLGGMPIAVHRNYFGSQLASFEAPLEIEDPVVRSSVVGEQEGISSSASSTFTGIFIRAPAILKVGEGVTPIAWVNRAHRDANVPDLPLISTPYSSSSASSTPVHSSSSSESSSTNPRVIVAARNTTFLVTAFHPELTESPGFHRLFTEQVEHCVGKKLLHTIQSLQGLDIVIPLTATGGKKSTSSIENNNEGFVTMNEEQTVDMTSRGNSGSLLIARRVVHGTPMH
jgi:glutamine amidotransferase PdxT